MGKSGILYVVGTGPGSSELMTLGAVKTLQKCPVTQSKSGQQKSRALETVKGAVDLGKKILLPLEFSMRKNDSHQACSQRIYNCKNCGIFGW